MKKKLENQSAKDISEKILESAEKETVANNSERVLKYKWQKFKNSKVLFKISHSVFPIVLPFIIVMIFLIIIPLIGIIVYSIVKPTGNSLLFEISFENFIKMFTDKNIMMALLLSVLYALIAAFLCIILGYPIAYIMWRLKSKLLAKNIWVLVTMPIWISMLMKVLGLQSLFYILAPGLLGTPIAVIIGMIYMFLPFAITPIYNALETFDPELERASRDLGAGSIRTFWAVIFRQTIFGMITGFSLVIVQASTSLLVVHYIGNGKITLIATIIESYFFKGSNFGYGAAISVVLAFLILILMIIFKLLSNRAEYSKRRAKIKGV
ncbi:spermidine/putrescine ABC transporter permease [Spiroplasma endosymbiont of Labia minor]|uniref:spermidine/putrescine ABC transporter permease n=1 Tax=Spiroplasma endosymbiont of Labia minor TaxID=3066305 RepID=UPI0030D62237